MKVHKLVGSIGYSRNILNNFSFILWDKETDEMIRVDQPSSDEYIHLCGRDVVEWTPREDSEDSGIEIVVTMKHWDREIFNKNFKNIL